MTIAESIKATLDRLAFCEAMAREDYVLRAKCRANDAKRLQTRLLARGEIARIEGTGPVRALTVEQLAAFNKMRDLEAQMTADDEQTQSGRTAYEAQTAEQSGEAFMHLRACVELIRADFLTYAGEAHRVAKAILDDLATRTDALEAAEARIAELEAEKAERLASYTWSSRPR